jgi:hypothetical protein
MPDSREPFLDAPSDALRRRIRSDQIRVITLERLKLLQERIELGIRNLRVLMDVIALFVMTDLLTELL